MLGAGGTPAYAAPPTRTLENGLFGESKWAKYAWPGEQRSSSAFATCPVTGAPRLISGELQLS